MRAAKSQSRGPVSRGRRGLFLPAIALDRSSATPLYQQLRAQLATAVTRGTHNGARLPSTRLLARMLGVSRNTVVLAYEELVASGVIEGRPGSAMTVAGGGTAPSGPFDALRLLRAAQYPIRTVAFADPDGAALYLLY